ncbi:MAG: hypothetical protein CM1200mP15_02420 [Dehalococcoidia bacterium]|nr:MAG: hypothetical protein CM1200mP15_02420 [Dehalococcoidia bacterium]
MVSVRFRQIISSDNLSNAVLPDKSIWESDGIDIPVDSEAYPMGKAKSAISTTNLTARLRDSSNNYFDLPWTVVLQRMEKFECQFDSLDDITPTRRRAANKSLEAFPLSQT